MSKARVLSKAFNEGDLNDIVAEVKKDNSLLFQIRAGYISVYYKGSSALKYEMNKKITIDAAYTKDIETIDDWINNISSIKQAIDYYITKYPKQEREFQQIVVRANTNSTASNKPEYFIVDTECADSENKLRYDMIAIKWSIKNKVRAKKYQLSLIEMKYGDTALSNMGKHLKDIVKFSNDSSKMNELREQTIQQFKTLRDLDLVGLIEKNNYPVDSFIDKIEYIILLANMNPRRANARNVIKQVRECQKEIADTVEIKFAVSTFMGYGLNTKGILDIDTFERFCDLLEI